MSDSGEGSVQAEEGSPSALVFSESVRAVQDQAAVVDGLRSRAGLMISAASLVTGFFAGVALGTPEHLDLWGWVATGLFSSVAGISLWILWPRQEWAFTSDPTDLVRDYVDAPNVTLPRAERNLSIYLGQAFANNKAKLRWLFFWFEIACVLLVLEVVFWIVDIVTR